ncbi:MAG: alanine racemase [Rhodanobacteraceae bacterium]
MRSATATIHLGALRANLRRVREFASHAKVMAVVKADAYGHGLERVARALDQADAFGVADIADGQRLRAAGIAQRIVVLSGLDDAGDLAELRRLQLEAVIHHDAQLEWLAADHTASPIKVWLKIDSGMHRLGFDPERAREVHARLKTLPNVEDGVGLMTHFARSDEFENALTSRQADCFEHATAGLDGERSLANSAAIIGWPGTHANWVRAGGALYGISVIAGKTAAEFGLNPAMTLSSRLIAIKRIGAGDQVGYGATWSAREGTILGIASIGYGDGYPRHAGSGTPVLVEGRRAHVVGRVSMDLIAIDLQGHPDARVGDTVVLWGRGLAVEEIAAHAGTIGYDLTCGVTRRVRFAEDDED